MYQLSLLALGWGHNHGGSCVVAGRPWGGGVLHSNATPEAVVPQKGGVCTRLLTSSLVVLLRMLRISSVSLTFLIVTFHPPPQAADIMADFFERVAREPSYWDKISKAGLERIYSR